MSLFLFIFFSCLLSSDAVAVGEDSVTDPGVEALKTGMKVLYYLILIPVLALFSYIGWFIYKNFFAQRFQTTIQEDYQKEAEKLEKDGRYVLSAVVYESKLKKRSKAAMLYEKGGDFRKAAELYDLLGLSDKAKEMYERSGDVDSAAEVSLMEGDFEEAAKIYDQAGKKLDAALALERAGHKMAAVREYREAGKFKRAAELLEEEGFIKEAAEMYGYDLRGKTPDRSNIETFYAYATKLEVTGQTEKAVKILRTIDSIDPTYQDVREKLSALTTSPEDEKELEGKAALRQFISSGELEPKNSLKLWVHILQKLQDEYQEGRPYGLIAPENILIDSNNNISFLTKVPSAAYTPPEESKELELDSSADIYSMGVILFEMLSGSLEGLGSMSVADMDPDLPEWLDEMVIKCIRKVREDRYQSIDEIIEAIKALSMLKKESRN